MFANLLNTNLSLISFFKFFSETTLLERLVNTKIMNENMIYLENEMSSGGEMPRGDMNQNVSNYSSAENQLKTIDLSGLWKLQLTIN